MKRLENYQKPSNAADLHGYDGPIAISNGGQITPVAQDFLRASHAIGIPFSGKCSYIVHARARALTGTLQTISRVSANVC